MQDKETVESLLKEIALLEKEKKAIDWLLEVKKSKLPGVWQLEIYGTYGNKRKIACESFSRDACVNYLRIHYPSLILNHSTDDIEHPDGLLYTQPLAGRLVLTAKPEVVERLIQHHGLG